jgi:hypothetical protein
LTIDDARRLAETILTAVAQAEARHMG